MFADRRDAGEQLADRLVEAGVDADVVFGIPRGGLPVARAVADSLDCPLDVVAVKKMGAPGNPELAVGAVAADGTDWVNEALVARVGVSEAALDRARAEAAETAREKEATYRGGDPFPELTGETAVVVDDGLATGATAVAAVRRLRAAGAERVVLAVPVAAPDAVERLRAEADEVVAVDTPPWFSAVGQFYRNFAQVSDTEARDCLDRE